MLVLFKSMAPSDGNPKRQFLFFFSFAFYSKFIQQQLKQREIQNCVILFQLLLDMHRNKNILKFHCFARFFIYFCFHFCVLVFAVAVVIFVVLIKSKTGKQPRNVCCKIKNLSKCW